MCLAAALLRPTLRQRPELGCRRPGVQVERWPNTPDLRLALDDRLRPPYVVRWPEPLCWRPWLCKREALQLGHLQAGH